MKEIFLPEDQLPRLLDGIEEKYEVILFTSEKVIPYQLWNRDECQQLSLREPRSKFPAKSFFLPLRESVALYGVESLGEEKKGDGRKPLALVNLRNCDVQALAILDRIFLEGDWIDPFYQQRRDEVLVVSVDCVDIADFCFCPLLGYKPVVEKGTELNLSPISEGYIVRAEGERGEAILESLGNIGSPVGASQQREWEQNYEATVSALRQSNERFEDPASYYEILKAGPPAEKWNDLFATCVECGSCTNVCPTCYCFYLFDQTKFPDREGIYEKLRSWDSCLLADYSRMAGGPAKPNPRPRLRSRYENRFRHKYQYHYEIHGQYGCTGCGRCAQACLGKTDPREVMRVLSR